MDQPPTHAIECPALGYCGSWKSEITFSGAWSPVGWRSTTTAAMGTGTMTLSLTTKVGIASGEFLVEIDANTANAEIMLVTAGNGTGTLTVMRGQCGTSPVTHQAGAIVTNPYAIGPYGLGLACDGGPHNIITWTKPGGYEAQWPVENLSLYVTAGLATGAQLSTSVDGGTTWQDIPGTLPTSGAPQLPAGGFEPPLFTSATTSVMLRAADASPTPIPAAIQGFFGLQPWPGGVGSGNATLIINNFAKSDYFLFSLPGDGPQPFIVEDDGPNYLQTEQLVIIGPYTNDGAVGWPGSHPFSTPSAYQSQIEALIAHYPTGKALVLGAFEQQGIDAYSCAVTNGSPSVTLVAPASYTSSYLSAYGYPRKKVTAPAPYLSAIDVGRDVFDPSGNRYLAEPAAVASIGSTSACTLTRPWTGPTGQYVLIFDGRDIPTQDAFRGAAKTAAQVGGAKYLNLYAQWGTFPQALAAGLMWDSLHESQQGHTNIAALISNRST